MKNDNFSDNNNQFVLSYELLALLRWLSDHDTQGLKHILEAALKSGLHDEMSKIENTDELELLDDEKLADEMLEDDDLKLEDVLDELVLTAEMLEEWMIGADERCLDELDDDDLLARADERTGEEARQVEEGVPYHEAAAGSGRQDRT